MTLNFNLQQITNMFTHSKGFYFSRWNKSISPVVFGTDDETLEKIKRSYNDIISITGLHMIEIDAEFGANLLTFFCRDWSELRQVPNVDKLIPDLEKMIVAFDSSNANQYRRFSLNHDGSIKFCLVFLKYNRDLSSLSIEALAKIQILKALLLWSRDAFKGENPIVGTLATEACKLSNKFSKLLEVCYDPVLPNSTDDESHALRLLARLSFQKQK